MQHQKMIVVEELTPSSAVLPVAPQVIDSSLMYLCDNALLEKVCRSNFFTSISLLESTDGTSSACDSPSRSLSLSVRRLQHLSTNARQSSAQMETNSVGSEVTKCMSLDVSSINKSSMGTKSPSSTPGLRNNEERKNLMSSSSSNLGHGNATHSTASQQAYSMCDNISEQSFTSNQVIKMEF